MTNEITLKKWIGLLAILVIVLITTISSYEFFSQRRSEAFSEQVLNNLVAYSAHHQVRSLSEENWDTVCHVGPYHSNPGNLPHDLIGAASEFNFKPRTWFIEEDEVGLLFLNTETHKGRVAKFPRSIIREIEGPRCLLISNARFGLQSVVAKNITYKILVLH